jgi:hypothetical protein
LHKETGGVSLPARRLAPGLPLPHLPVNIDKVVQSRKIAIFHSFDEADRADKAYYLSLTPEQRLRMVAELRTILYGPDDDSAPRLARVYRIVELPRR